MPAGFASWSENGIHAGSLEFAGFLDRRRGRDDARAVGFERAHDDSVRSTEVTGEDRYAFFDHDSDLLLEPAKQVDRIGDRARTELGMDRPEGGLERGLVLGV